MRGLRLLGDYALEFFVVTLLVGLSAALVLPLVPMAVGVTAFFKTNIDTRRFKDIFTAIGRNIKLIIPFTIFELVIIVFPVLNLYFFNTHPDNTNYFVLAVCCVALVVGIMLFVTAPTVIINMKVKFFQLLYDSIILLFGSPLRTLGALAAMGGIVAAIMLFPYVLILLPYPVLLIVSKLMNANFLHIKAKALGSSVYELKKRETEDDYINENGEIDHSEDA